jgi:hypothetical protein
MEYKNWLGVRKSARLVTADGKNGKCENGKEKIGKTGHRDKEKCEGRLEPQMNADSREREYEIGPVDT